MKRIIITVLLMSLPVCGYAASPSDLFGGSMPGKTGTQTPQKTTTAAAQKTTPTVTAAGNEWTVEQIAELLKTVKSLNIRVIVPEDLTINFRNECEKP